MDRTLLVTLVLNASLLLALNILHEISFQLPRRLRRATPYLNGILIGLIGMTIMSIPFTFPNSIFFDTRTILVSVSALVFGPIPSTVAAVILIVFRLLKGNIGALMGVATIAGSWAIGLLVRRFLYHGRVSFQWAPMYLFGFGVHLYMLGCTVLLPASQAAVMLRAIALPVLLVYPAGSVLLTLTLLHQIERNEAATRIAEAESRYRTLFEGAGAAMLLIEPGTGRIIDANPAAEAFYGWSADVLRDMSITQINTRAEAVIRDEMARAAAENRHYFLFQHHRADGSFVDVEVYSGPIRLNGRTLLYSIIHDISDRVAYERERNESETRFRSVVEGSPIAIFIQLAHRFAYVNPATIRLYGAASERDLLGTPVIERFHPDYGEKIRERIRQLNQE